MTGPEITDPVLLALAEEVGTEDPVAIEGGRTRWGIGGESRAGTRLVVAPRGIVDYQPAEMTIRVRVGTLVRELHEELARAGQRTALPDRGGTVGGALAVGEDDVSSLGVGRVRTAALQVRYVSAEGRLVTGGGATVKNVTGFDLPRLLVGSLGTLGLLAEVILRTNPIPPVSVWLELDGADPFVLWDALFRPSALLWDGRRTWVQLEGHPADVGAQRQVLARLGDPVEVAGPPELPPHRWSLRRSELTTQLRTEAVGDHVASIGTGAVFASRPQPARPRGRELRDLERRVKETFDPTGRLNPGRDPAVR